MGDVEPPIGRFALSARVSGSAWRSSMARCISTRSAGVDSALAIAAVSPSTTQRARIQPRRGPRLDSSGLGRGAPAVRGRADEDSGADAHLDLALPPRARSAALALPTGPAYTPRLLRSMAPRFPARAIAWPRHETPPAGDQVRPSMRAILAVEAVGVDGPWIGIISSFPPPAALATACKYWRARRR